MLDADDLALVGARRRASNRLGFAVQLCALRHPGGVLDLSESPPAPMVVFVAQQIGVDPALFADYAQRDRDPPRACRRTAKVSGTAELRFRGLARLSSGRHGRGLGHGSRRTHRPGDARPSADERRLASGGGGVGANRVGRACPRAKEDLRDSRGRACPIRSGTRSRDCSRSIRSCAAPASPGCGIIRSRPRHPTSSRCWIVSNMRGGWESTQRAPDESMPLASPG